ncbi:MAG TPA: hypothetical protein VJQ77_01740 [Novosphingobium sp.]|nr:hypothetical protein [Novosphingobium sp.]
MALRLVRSEIPDPSRPGRPQGHRQQRTFAWASGRARSGTSGRSWRDGQAPGIELRIFRGLIYAAPFSLLMWALIAAFVTGSLL